MTQSESRKGSQRCYFWFARPLALGLGLCCYVDQLELHLRQRCPWFPWETASALGKWRNLFRRRHSSFLQGGVMVYTLCAFTFPPTGLLCIETRELKSPSAFTVAVHGSCVAKALIRPASFRSSLSFLKPIGSPATWMNWGLTHMVKGSAPIDRSWSPSSSTHYTSTNFVVWILQLDEFFPPFLSQY